MKKIAIVTINDNNNYGNRLQNYALQEVLKKINCINETIWFESKLSDRLVIKAKKFIKFLLPNWHTKMLKELRCRRFTQKYIHVRKKTNKELNNIKKEYEFFIVGSDQVWNYDHVSELKNYFLPFAEYNQTVAYSASFGVSNIEKKYEKIIKNGIEHIKYLSVRETRGKEMIKQITGKNSEVLVDPTLLINKEEWRKIEQKPKNLTSKNYILTYFLGNNLHKNDIQKLSEKYDLDVINLADIRQKKYYIFNPNEFIYLFDNAQIVYTDSFHACVFSIIFNKPFFVFDRNEEGVKNMNSRLDTLLSMLKQNHRKINKIEFDNKIFECDYLEGKKILEREKVKSLNFLKQALDLEN